MNNKVMYRELRKGDYEIIKELIGDAFGFSEFIKDPNFLNLVLNSYLQKCILDSSFSKVAIKNGKVIGIILGNANKDKNKIKSFHNRICLISSLIKIMFTKNDNKKDLKEFSKIQKTYKEIFNGNENNFQGCIQLFIVSKESRGLGVGKSLMNYLFDYMKSMKVKSMYLYTDTRCNYQFYDKNNFKRLNEKKIHFNRVNESLNIFLYGYNF